MEKEQQIDLIKFMLRQWKEAERELIVFKTAIKIVRDENQEMAPVLDRLLDACRKSGSVDTLLDHQFSEFEEMIEHIGEGSLEKVIREFQERFGSKFPIH